MAYDGPMNPYDEIENLEDTTLNIFQFATVTKIGELIEAKAAADDLDEVTEELAAEIVEEFPDFERVGLEIYIPEFAGEWSSQGVEKSYGLKRASYIAFKLFRHMESYRAAGLV